MQLTDNVRTWFPSRGDEREPFFDGDSTAFVASLIFHLCLLLALGLIPLAFDRPQISLTVAAATEELPEEELQLYRDFAVSNQPAEEIGADNFGGLQMAMSLAPVVSEISDIPSPSDLTPTVEGTIEINNEIQVATGLRFNENLAVRGAAGEGVTGATGAIDRLTEEILRSLEERKTLVVWLFDQSGSLARQRAAINDRFDRIYDELGVIEAAGNPAFARHDDKPLLTAVWAFGQGVTKRTDEETDDLASIKDAVRGIALDDSGVERVFTAIYEAAKRYKHYRTRRPGSDEPERNVLLIAFTDERGDDQKGLEATIGLCRQYGMPVYVVGVPAPFGSEETLVKWVDPDPQYDQTPQWGRVNQGPESLLPERVNVRFCVTDDGIDPIDSGFGPFALTRLCYETGGIYFAVHPNRNVHREVARSEVAAFSSHLKYFFDPQIMQRYKPDYVSPEQYMRRASANKARVALLRAAERSWMSSPVEPKVRFVGRSTGQLAQAISKARSQVQKTAPLLEELYQLLSAGEADRQKETTPRWQAGYDLAMGQVLAAVVRASLYDATLGIAQGKPFDDARNNTWVLVPTDDLTLQGQHSAFAQKAKQYLQRVTEQHPETPWARVAEYELQRPFGWKLVEQFTDLTPRRGRGIGAGGGGGGGGGSGLGRGSGGRAPARPARRPVPKL